MKVDIQDVLFWMDAIRNSDDRYRTLESFWKGQVNSKIWLIENLKKYVTEEKSRIVIHGGWNGVLASLLFNSDICISKIISVDIDPDCELIARTVNKRQEIEGRFEAVTADMTTYQCQADIIINTSCEHITQEQYDQWLLNVPDNALIILQSNNYYELDEHINCVSNLKEFEKSCKLNIVKSAILQLQKYERYMIIGKK